MDCVKFWTVIFAWGVILFFSLYLIVKYQSEFYPYGIHNKSESETAIFISAIFYLFAFVGFLIWGRKRDARRRSQYKNIPPPPSEPNFFDEKRNVSIEQDKQII